MSRDQIDNGGGGGGRGGEGKMAMMVEDSLEFQIYSLLDLSTEGKDSSGQGRDNSSGLDSDSSGLDRLIKLQGEVKLELDKLKLELGGKVGEDRGYLWHKGGWEVEVIKGESRDSSLLFRGKVSYGDGVEDEWVVTYLLWEVSRRVGERVAISIKDSDGQFLLFDLAEWLPKWVIPEVMDNRVFLVKGELILLDYERDLPLPLPQAITQLRLNYRTSSHLPPVAQTHLQRRLRQYPQRAWDHQHFTPCLLPTPLAKLLTLEPSLVAPAVEAYYLRDPVDMKTCHRLTKFPPKDTVLKTVYFTRTLFSQLAFQPLPSPLPPPFLDLLSTPSSDPIRQATELGIKLTCGFEILSTRNPEATYRFERDPRYHHCLNHLLTEGYFEGEVEGSARYQELEQRAQVQYLTSRASPSSLSPEVRLEALLSQDLSEVPVHSSWEGERSSLDWLDINPDDLQTLLKAQACEGLETFELDDERADPDVGEELSRLVNNVSLFLNQEAELEGPDLINDVTYHDDDDDGTSSDFIELDPDSFLRNVARILDGDPHPSDLDDDDEYARQLAAELQNTHVPLRPPPPAEGGADDDDGGSQSDTSSLDLDTHLVENFLASHHADPQFGPTHGFFPPPTQ